ncbi:MAG: hypothetical protein IKC77_06785 [Lentisphaeria bacterium]|nr:hypothetical protein [Lentisphaeria bacterium]
MKVQFLGTAAAEGIPAIWRECEVCRKAKQLGGKELRRRCSYLIDTDTIVDFGPDSFWQSIEFNIDQTILKRILFTHPHEDHMSPLEFYFRRSPYFSQVSHFINVLASAETLKTFIKFTGHEFKDLYINPIEFKPGKWHTDEDMEVLPIPANHAPGMGPMILAVRRNGKTLLIANDTGLLADSSWEMLKGVTFDTAVIESTCAFGVPDLQNGHLGVNTTVQFRDKLLEMGCITKDTPVYVNHFSHNGKANHDKLVEFFAPRNMTVAYDGLTIEL